LVRIFKLSNDRRFDEKLIDVVGVYLNPPDNAVVLCMDDFGNAKHRRFAPARRHGVRLTRPTDPLSLQVIR
jgi:hypothetical protein